MKFFLLCRDVVYSKCAFFLELLSLLEFLLNGNLAPENVKWLKVMITFSLFFFILPKSINFACIVINSQFRGQDKTSDLKRE